MHFDTIVLKLKSDASDLAKKICSFLDYFLFYRSLKLVAFAVATVGLWSISQKKKDHKKDSVLFTVIINNYLWIP